MKGNFKLILVVVFIICAVLAVMVFADVIHIGGDKVESPLSGSVVLWGTAPNSSMSTLVDDFNFFNKTVKLSYVQKSEATLNQDLLEALAKGKGPDLFLLPDNLAYAYSDKIYTIPYATYPLLNFKNYNVGASEVFLVEGGVLAFPISVDPLVMYYNRNILDANNIVYPPATWDEFNVASSKITKKNEANELVKSAVALGQYSNVNNAKDIVATLFMQTGNSIVKQIGGKFLTTMAEAEYSKNLGDALSFYVSFADPTKPSYTWKKTLPNSEDAFSSDSVAFYFGFASELPKLINKNPNQNLGIALMPQVKNANAKVTKGKVTGIAVSAFSKNFNTAYGVANLLASGNFARDYVKLQGIAPARRDILAQKPEGLYQPVFYDSALISKSWLDPSPKDTENIFRYMIESALSNNLKPKDAVSDAGGRINLLFK